MRGAGEEARMCCAVSSGQTENRFLSSVSQKDFFFCFTSEYAEKKEENVDSGR